MEKDCYKILGISEEEKKLKGEEFEKILKKKFRSIAMQAHPDRQNGKSEGEKKKAEEKFKEASEAYDTLLNHREEYDNPSKKFTYSGSPFDDMGFADIFSRFGMDMGGFGFDFNGGGSKGEARGSSIRINLGISLEDAYKGTVKKIKYKRLEICENCNGSGMVENSKRKTCKTCGGSGTYFNINSFIKMAQTCPTCGGQGQFIENPCPKCNGHGIRQKTTDEVEVKIDKGVISGMYITLQGMGNFPPKGKGVPGDLIINIEITNTGKYEIIGNNVIVPIEVNVLDAILGCEAELDTVDGKHLTIKIPRGTTDGYKMKFKGYGIPVYGTNNSGDIIGVIKVMMPKKLNNKEIKLINELKEQDDFKF